MKRVAPTELASEIGKILDEFQGATEDAVADAIIDVAEDAVRDLREANPPGSGKYSSWSKYNSGWERTKLESRKDGFKSIVHNKKHYQLTHLLEHGHALRGGGSAKAFPHIAPVEENVEKSILSKIKKRMSNT